MIFNDELYKRQYNDVREECLLREYDDHCVFDERRKHATYCPPQNRLKPIRRDKRKCIPDEYTKCPLFVFIKKVNNG